MDTYLHVPTRLLRNLLKVKLLDGQEESQITMQKGTASNHVWRMKPKGEH